MPMKGTFDADFQPFVRETQRAETELKRFEAGATKVSASFTRMSDTGGNAFRSFHLGLSQVDRTLGSVGVNIGPQVAALSEMSVVAGKTAAQLGAVATGSAVLAAGIAGWKFGRQISEWLGLDKAIGDATARLLGWGDVAAQTAGAKADILARASKTAGREIVDLSEAMKINSAAAKQLTEDTKKAAEEEKRLAVEAKRAREEFTRDVHAMWERRAKEREAAQKKEAEALARTEKEWRDYQNFLGERYMQDEAARLAKEVNDHKAATEAKIAEEKRWWATVNQGMLITDPGLSARMGGQVIFNEHGLVPTIGGGSRGVTLFNEQGHAVPGASSAPPLTLGGGPMRFGFTGQGGMVVNNNIDARGALFNDHASQQRLFEMIDRATSGRMRSTGARF